MAPGRFRIDFWMIFHSCWDSFRHRFSCFFPNGWKTWNRRQYNTFEGFSFQNGSKNEQFLRVGRASFSDIDIFMHFGCPLAPCWLPLASFWFPLAPFGSLLDPFWLPFGYLLATCGSILVPFGSLLPSFWLNFDAFLNAFQFFNLFRMFPFIFPDFMNKPIEN